MNSHYIPHTPSRAQFRTRMARDAAENAVRCAKAFEIDSDRAARERHGCCRYCWYFRSSMVAGQAITTWSCGVCGREQVHANTGHGTVCESCAREHQLCHQCGGDLAMRASRRTWPTPVAAPATASSNQV